LVQADRLNIRPEEVTQNAIIRFTILLLRGRSATTKRAKGWAHSGPPKVEQRLLRRYETVCCLVIRPAMAPMCSVWDGPPRRHLHEAMCRLRVHFFSVSEIKSIKLRSHIQRLGAVNYRVAICYTRGARFTL
jgi:hypothetical protein